LVFCRSPIRAVKLSGESTQALANWWILSNSSNVLFIFAIIAFETGVAGAYKIFPRSNGLIKGQTIYPTSLLCSIVLRISEQSTLLSSSIVSEIIRWFNESVWFICFISSLFFSGIISSSTTCRWAFDGLSISAQNIFVIFESWPKSIYYFIK
jgi:hypothetical protein